MEPISEGPPIATNLSRGCIVATLPADLDPGVLAELCSQVLHRLHETRARGVILDCSSVEVMDAYDFDGLLGFRAMAALMGAQVVLAGVRPGVASALADLDVDAPHLRGALTLDEAFALLQGAFGAAQSAERRAQSAKRNSRPSG
jgi:rsbT antagonist protein RsbS